MSSSFRWSRRGFLAAAGTSAVLSPFIPLLGAEAADDDHPHRLLIVYHPNGGPPSGWMPSGSERNFALGSTLASLEPFKDALIVLSGLSADRGGDVGEAHRQYMAACLTGARLGNDEWPTGPSIDQVIADHVGGQTPFRSLELSLQTKAHRRGNHVTTRMCYRGQGEPVTPEDDPYAVFDRLFADLDPGDGGGMQLERLRARRRSTIDVVKGELDHLKGRIGADDGHKLDAHLTALRAIETRLDGSMACSIPEVAGGVDPNDNDSAEVISDLQTDLLVQALACDLTRVATLQWHSSFNDTYFPWIGLGRHHGVMHEQPFDEAAQRGYHRWYCEQFARLLAGLDAVPEGDGTLLDHTTVVWTTEMAQGGPHTKNNLPVVIAGGPAFELGRWIDRPGRSRNDLMISLAQAMGLDLDSFGDWGEGPLPGLVSA